MKYLLKFLWLFIPREGEDDAAAAEAEAAAAAAKPPGGGDPEDRPDWCQEKFWNPDTKAPRTEVGFKAYNELEGKLRNKTEELKAEVLADMKAAAPEAYEVNLSDDLKIPDNVELDLTAEDPLVSWFFGFAKEYGMSQEIVDKAINDYIGIEIAAMPDVAKEIEKLGDHGQDRMLRVHNWMETKLSDDQFKSLNPLLSSATQVEALEALMKSTGPGDFEGEGAGPALTLAELRTMQDDPKAWRDKDPVWLAKIEAGYKRLYGGKK